MGTVTANMEQPVVDVVAGRSYFCYPLKDTQGNLIRFQMKGGITENILVRFDSGLDPALSPSCEVNVENQVGPLQTFHKREQWPKIVFSETSDRHVVQLKDENTYFGNPSKRMALRCCTKDRYSTICTVSRERHHFEPGSSRERGSSKDQWICDAGDSKCNFGSFWADRTIVRQGSRRHIWVILLLGCIVRL
jgi:hypothetical protein